MTYVEPDTHQYKGLINRIYEVFPGHIMFFLRHGVTYHSMQSFMQNKALGIRYSFAEPPQ